jgi:hypothetical protein
MYGRLLLRQDKRENEANGNYTIIFFKIIYLELLQKSENLIQQLPFWYHRMVKTRFLDFDFN